MPQRKLSVDEHILVRRMQEAAIEREASGKKLSAAHKLVLEGDQEQRLRAAKTLDAATRKKRRKR